MSMTLLGWPMRQVIAATSWRHAQEFLFLLHLVIVGIALIQFGESLLATLIFPERARELIPFFKIRQSLFDICVMMG
jgi:hypothetical protein